MNLADARNLSDAESAPVTLLQDMDLPRQLAALPAIASQDTAPLKKVREFDGTPIAVSERFDAWHDSFDFFYEAKPAADPAQPANWRHCAWQMDDLLVTTHDLGPFVGHRGPKQIKRDMGYELLVRYVREGMQHSLHEDIPVVMQAGRIYVYRADREFSTLVKDRVKTIAVGLSFAPGTIDPDFLPNFLALEPAAPNTKILMNVMERMEAAVQGRRQIYEPGLDRQFRAVLKEILSPAPTRTPPHKSAMQARRTAMKSFVDKNLDKPGFDVDQLLSAFGASRATIFRDFAEDGGLRHYVNSRRLNHAFRALAYTKPARGKIQEIATDRGFPDVGHFCRLFRQQFGITPSDALLIGSLPK